MKEKVHLHEYARTSRVASKLMNVHTIERSHHHAGARRWGRHDHQHIGLVYAFPGGRDFYSNISYLQLFCVDDREIAAMEAAFQ
jgi:hypothetical protein